MFHYEGGAWVAVTYSLGTVNNVIVGQVNSLSPVGVAGASTPATGYNLARLAALAFALILMGIAVRVSSLRLTGT